MSRPAVHALAGAHSRPAVVAPAPGALAGHAEPPPVTAGRAAAVGVVIGAAHRAAREGRPGR
ncbi:hypothetical protein [Streptomyces sp. NPDC056387]|uniref:hypothetical protein n=1 Tax=Streptomyces sp. NPDC056387 TaxID=3345803 RepID=UPI0035E16FC0